MLFFSLSNINIQFNTRKFIQSLYIAAKTLNITQQIELINIKEFAKTALNKNSKTFVVYIAALKILKIIIYLFQAMQVALLQKNKAPTKTISKYWDHANVFWPSLQQNYQNTQYKILLKQ